MLLPLMAGAEPNLPVMMAMSSSGCNAPNNNAGQGSHTVAMSDHTGLTRLAKPVAGLLARLRHHACWLHDAKRNSLRGAEHTRH
jgi:hypothetical protein